MSGSYLYYFQLSMVVCVIVEEVMGQRPSDQTLNALILVLVSRMNTQYVCEIISGSETNSLC